MADRQATALTLAKASKHSILGTWGLVAAHHGVVSIFVRLDVKCFVVRIGRLLIPPSLDMAKILYYISFVWTGLHTMF